MLLTKRTSTLMGALATIAAFGTAVACSETGEQDAVTSSSVSVDGNLVVPANADLVYDVSSGFAGSVVPVGLDRVSFRPAAAGRAMTLSEERAVGSTTALLTTTLKGHVSYQRSLSPVFTFDIFSVPSTSTDAPWTPIDGPIVNDALAARSEADGALATVVVHRLHAVEATDSAGGRTYRAVFGAHRRVIENAASVKESETTNANWSYRNVVVAVGVADYFVPRGSLEIGLVRAAEYRLIGDDVTLGDVDSLEAVRAKVSTSDTYVTRRCLRNASGAAVAALGSTPPSGLAIDDCQL